MYESDNGSVAQTLVELDSLVENMLLLLSDKEKVVVSKRFNLDGKRKHTLEEIGQDFSVTRERVRQIEKNALSKMRRNVFNTSLRHLHDYSSSLISNHGGVMKEEVLFEKLSELLLDSDIDESRVRLALVIHEELACVGNTINFYPYVRAGDVTEFSLKHASGQLVNQMHKYGDVKNVTRVHKDMSGSLSDFDMDVKLMKSLIGIDKRVALLDGDMVGLVEWRHIHPRTLRDKVLYILRGTKKPMHFGDIAAQIESATFDKRPVNLQAVHNELIRHAQFILIGRGIYALEEWGYEKGTVAEVVEKLLKENKELDLDEIVDAVLKKRQVKRITIVLALKNNTKFERIGRRRYKLKS